MTLRIPHFRKNHEHASRMNPQYVALILGFVLRVASGACVAVRLVQRHYFSIRTSHNVLTPEHDHAAPKGQTCVYTIFRNFDTWGKYLRVCGRGSESQSNMIMVRTTAVHFPEF